MSRTLAKLITWKNTSQSSHGNSIIQWFPKAKRRTARPMAKRETHLSILKKRLEITTWVMTTDPLTMAKMKKLKNNNLSQKPKMRIKIIMEVRNWRRGKSKFFTISNWAIRFIYELKSKSFFGLWLSQSFWKRNRWSRIGFMSWIQKSEG